MIEVIFFTLKKGVTLLIGVTEEFSLRGVDNL